MPNHDIVMCPAGHGPMNCHAEKPVDPMSPEDEKAWERGTGPIEEIHECPLCGAIESRHVTN